MNYLNKNNNKKNMINYTKSNKSIKIINNKLKE